MMMIWIWMKNMCHGKWVLDKTNDLYITGGVCIFWQYAIRSARAVQQIFVKWHGGICRQSPIGKV